MIGDSVTRGYAAIAKKHYREQFGSCDSVAVSGFTITHALMQQHKRKNAITTGECETVYEQQPPLRKKDQSVPYTKIPQALDLYPTDQRMQQYTNIIIGLGTNDITHQCRLTTAYDKDPTNLPTAIAIALADKLIALVAITRERCPNATIHILPIPPRSDGNGAFGIESPTHSQKKFATEVTTLLNDRIALMQTEALNLQHVIVEEYPSSSQPGRKDIMRDAVHVNKSQSTRVVHYIIESMKV